MHANRFSETKHFYKLRDIKDKVQRLWQKVEVSLLTPEKGGGMQCKYGTANVATTPTCATWKVCEGERNPPRGVGDRRTGTSSPQDCLRSVQSCPCMRAASSTVSHSPRD